MDTRKFKQVPSISMVGSRNPRIPRPVVVSAGKKGHSRERTITRPVRTDSRTIGTGGSINWEEVYN